MPNNGPEIDTLVSLPGKIRGQENGLMLGSSKRNPLGHMDSKSPAQVFGSFLQHLYDKKGLNSPPTVRYFLSSPGFTHEQHAELQKRGFDTIDLPAMASTLNTAT